MVSLIIFLLVAAAVIGGIVFLVIITSKSNDDPLAGKALSASAPSNSDQASRPTKRPAKPFDWSKFFLSLGPVIAGLGVVGIVFQYWDDYTIQVKLSIAIVALLVVDLVGLFLFQIAHRKQSSALSIVAKSLLILGSFLLGGVLFLIGQALNLNDLNMQALLGVWFLGILPFTFMVRNAWQFGVNALIGLIFIINYLSFAAGIGTGFTRVEDFLGFFGSLWFYYGVVCLFVLANVILSGWLRYVAKELNRQVSLLLKYGFQILGFLSLFVVVISAMMVQDNLSNTLDPAYQLMLLGGGLAFFFIPLVIYLLLKTRDLAKIWWLSGATVAVAGLFVFINPEVLSPFTGFYLLQIPLVLWAAVDYLEKQDPLTGILAYGSNTIFYFIWSFDRDLFSSLSLMVGAITLLLLAMRYTEKKDFVIYTWIAVGISALIKVLILGLDASWALLIAGLFLMLIGIYLLRLKSRSSKS